MLTAAYMGYMTNVLTGNLILSVIVAVLSGGLMALLHAWLSIHFKVDQIISGTVINILAVGLTGYFYQPGAVTKGKLQSVTVPVLSDIPIIGDVFFNNGPLTYLAVALVFVVNVVLFRTRWGLRMDAFRRMGSGAVVWGSECGSNSDSIFWKCHYPTSVHRNVAICTYGYSVGWVRRPGTATCGHWATL